MKSFFSSLHYTESTPLPLPLWNIPSIVKQGHGKVKFAFLSSFSQSFVYLQSRSLLQKIQFIPTLLHWSLHWSLKAAKVLQQLARDCSELHNRSIPHVMHYPGVRICSMSSAPYLWVLQNRVPTGRYHLTRAAKPLWDFTFHSSDLSTGLLFLGHTSK